MRAGFKPDQLHARFDSFSHQPVENGVSHAATTPLAAHIHALHFREFWSDVDPAAAGGSAVVMGDKKADIGSKNCIKP